MIRNVIRRLSSPRAQALIEFAFVAPLMFMFLFTIVDFGIAMDRRITLQHAVREGSRFAAVHTDAADIRQRTVDQAQELITTADVGVCYLDQDGDGDVGDPGDGVRVGASFTWDFPILREMFGAFGLPPLSIDMTPSGTARLERSVSGAAGC